MSAAMVRALLDGRKTQTRRVLKPQLVPCLSWSDPPPGTYPSAAGWSRIPYAPGDRLYVQEDWCTIKSLDDQAPSDMRKSCLDAGYPSAWAPIEYLADGTRDNWKNGDEFGRRRWSRHMLRELSRLTLTITEVRVQRLQEISGRDMLAEGVRCQGCHDVGTGDFSACRDGGCFEQRGDFVHLWDSLHGLGAWAMNPWVCALTFVVHRKNIDRL